MTTSVVNIRSLPRDPADWPPDCVYIGRPMPNRGLPKNPWGNPFSLLTMSRDEAVAAYEEYVLKTPRLMKRLPELKGKRLVCWCWPERCHGHVLARLADES